MAKLRKMLGDVDSPECIAMMRLIETQSETTLARWALGYVESRILPASGLAVRMSRTRSGPAAKAAAQPRACWR